MKELKPCPFCGSKKTRFVKKMITWHLAMCGCCGASSGYWFSREQAAESWNTRREKTCSPKWWDNASGAAFARGECSECGGYLLEDIKENKPRPYCPHCGAKVIWHE